VPAEQTAPPLDRRKRKSRAALQKALLDLITEKPYAAITVEDIAARADVVRGTFYAHFQGKDTLLLESTRELLAELAVEADAAAPQGEPVFTGAALRVLFDHAEAHRDLYRLLLTGEGGRDARLVAIETLRSVTTVVFSRLVAAQKSKPRVPMPALVTAFVGACILTLEAQVVGELEGDAEDRIRALVQSQLYGVAWALGLDPSDVKYVGRPPGRGL
jgi:AcrR family transcriptional regulator